MSQFQFASVVEEPPSLAAHHTLVAMTLAVCAHAMLLLWWHVFSPDIEDIPVRVLHVKLGSGGDIFTNTAAEDQSAGGGASSADSASAQTSQNSAADSPSSAASGAKPATSRDIATAPNGSMAMPSAPKPVEKPNELRDDTDRSQPSRPSPAVQPTNVEKRVNPAQQAANAQVTAPQAGPAQGEGRARTGEGRHRFVRPAGSPLGEAGRKQAEVIARYEQLLSAWIEKHKRYPTSAKRKNLEGRAIVRLRIDRGGRVIFHRLELRTGHGLLDQAALDMVARANPVPSVPEGYPKGELLEFLIPVSFRLQ